MIYDCKIPKNICVGTYANGESLALILAWFKLG